MTLLASATSLERRADGAAVAVDRPAASRRLNHDVVRALLSKDMAAARRSRSIVLPMLVVPFVLLVGLPVGIAIYARAGTPPDLGRFLEQLPGPIARDLSALPAQQRLLELVLGYLVAPLFLIVPMMISSALAADSFAGEKERRTLESLLHLPVEERDLFVSKVLFAFLPTVAVSWIGFALYSVAANVVAWPVMGRVFVPTWRWVGLIVFLAPAVAMLGLGVMVRVSARARTTQEANQLGGAVIMPLILASVGQTSGLLMMEPYWIFVASIVVWAIALLLVRGGLRRFTRDRVASRL
ncbi:MAG TPA: ABC transporter permease subunit [Microthrixaceae bacterium]|nr:ABC transporter permease subunit [Microthrixaceae bacterium]